MPPHLKIGCGRSSRGSQPGHVELRHHVGQQQRTDLQLADKCCGSSTAAYGSQLRDRFLAAQLRRRAAQSLQHAAGHFVAFGIGSRVRR